jgi:superoxide dismutase
MSILEKSDSKMMRIDGQMKSEVMNLLWHIKSHELFFSSFTINRKGDQKNRQLCDRIRYDVYCEAMAHDYGYLYVFNDRGLKIKFSDNSRNCYDIKDEWLCIDLYEHCYILDYGYKKDRFLKNALAYFDIERLLDN